MLFINLVIRFYRTDQAYRREMLEMLEMNCSTLQFCPHGAYIDHMHFIAYMIKTPVSI